MKLQLFGLYTKQSKLLLASPEHDSHNCPVSSLHCEAKEGARGSVLDNDPRRETERTSKKQTKAL